MGGSSFLDEQGNFTVKKFDMKQNMPENPVVMICAKRRSGKSILIRDMLYHLRDRFDVVIVFSGTEMSNQFYSPYVPKAFIYHTWDEDAVRRIISRQQTMLQSGQAKNVCLVLDDLAFDKKSMNSKLMKQLLYNGRHLKITMIASFQYQLNLDPSTRSNVDIFITMKDNMFRKKLFDNFFSFLPNIGFFNALMDTCTDNYKCLILHNATNSNDIKDTIFYYKAKMTFPPFKLCHRLYWECDKNAKKKSSSSSGSGSSKIKLSK